MFNGFQLHLLKSSPSLPPSPLQLLLHLLLLLIIIVAIFLAIVVVVVVGVATGISHTLFMNYDTLARTTRRSNGLVEHVGYGKALRVVTTIGYFLYVQTELDLYKKDFHIL